MAQKVVIELEAKSNEAIKNIDKLNSELKETSSAAKDANKSLNKTTGGLNNTSNSAKKLSSSLSDVRDNGGAIAILDSLTGGLATRVRDAFEATKLFNFSLKGTKKALIATGIGALVVSLGLVIAYWDDIIDLINNASGKLKEQEGIINEQIATQDIQLDLLKQQIAIEELKTGESILLTKEYRKQLLIQQEQNIALLKNLETQLKLAKGNESKRKAEEELVKTLFGQETAKALIVKAGEKEKEITDKINEAKKKGLNIETQLAQIDAKKREKLKQKDLKAKEDKKKKDDEELKAEKEKADAIERIRQGLIDTEDERRKEELRKIKADYDEQIKLAEKYYKEDKAKVLALREAQKNAINEQQLKFDEEDKKKTEEKSQIAAEKLALEKENDLLSFDEQRKIINERAELLKNDETINDEDRLKLTKQFTEAKNKIKDLEVQAEKKRVADTSNALDQLSDVVGKNTVAGKGMAVAAATINTYQGVTDALAAKTITPFETALKFVNAGAILANGLKNVKQITSVKIPNASGGSGTGGASTPSGGGVSTPSQPPSFNVVGASDTNQLASAIGSQAQEPTRAYVVSNDVTTAQSMDRNIVDGASI